jgi:hypothetical protein
MCTAGIAHAGLVTYTESVTASGFFNGIAFTNELVTLSMTADTSGVVQTNFIYELPGTVAVTIAGTGTGTFLDPMAAFDTQSVPEAGFTDAGLQLTLFGTVDSAFAAYTLAGNIGPITNTKGYQPPFFGNQWRHTDLHPRREFDVYRNSCGSKSGPGTGELESSGSLPRRYRDRCALPPANLSSLICVSTRSRLL